MHVHVHTDVCVCVCVCVHACVCVSMFSSLSITKNFVFAGCLNMYVCTYGICPICVGMFSFFYFEFVFPLTGYLRDGDIVLGT